MVGGGLKKFALENGMKVSCGIAYGNLRGFAASMDEGANYKRITFSTKIADSQSQWAVLNAAQSDGAKKQYKIQKVGITDRAITVVFLDTIGTMKRIRQFVDWFTPLLQQYGATGWNVCPECGAQVSVGRWVAIQGVAYYVHDTCCSKIQQEISVGEQEQKRTRTGSYASGTIGALLGAAVGGAVWALVLMAGYMASVVGLLIGWLSNVGYGLLRGKQGKPKVAILIVAVIFGVVLGTGAGYYLSLSKEFGGITLGEFAELFAFVWEQSQEVRTAVIKDLVIGLLLAALGVFGIVRNTSAQVADTKVQILE